MKPFLEYVAEDIIRKHGTDLSRTAVVFPNKRASLFLNELLVRNTDRPMWSPAYTTIRDLFKAHSQLKCADPIKLVCDLHKSFCKCTGSTETLDHFYGWGQLLIADFDDIDKNMADAKKVFANLRDIHEMDDLSYLEQEQIEILKKFFRNFSEGSNTELKRRFLNLWSNFYSIYKDFNERLEQQHLTYEGALYRKVVCDDSISFERDRYIFVGFNLLQKVEQKLFMRLKEQGKAHFYWDFDNYYMQCEGLWHNEAGHFIRQYLDAFPNELDTNDRNIYDNFAKTKTISFMAAQTENVQARYVSTWLRNNNRIAAGKRTAIVMADEKLLQPIIHSLPDEVDSVNITTGYPLSQTPIASEVQILISLQLNGYSPKMRKFRLRNINNLLKHPYARFASDRCSELYDKLNIETKVYFASPEQLSIDDGLAMIFTPLANAEGTVTADRLTTWLRDIIRLTATNSANDSNQMLQESLFRTYTLLNRLHDLIHQGDLIIDNSTLQRLIIQMIQSTNIPFHGEPAVGIQIMGVLETRNLDFDHVLLLSCNEGNMPKGINDTSFIPYNIRKAYGLTTIDNKVAIYAYYFHSLLQRATDITLVYNNAAGDMRTGEMSRFMLQMLVESNHEIRQYSLQPGLRPQQLMPQQIEKGEEEMKRLLQRFDKTQNPHKQGQPLLTPSAISRYMRCELQFYYNYVAGLFEDDDNDDIEIDSRIFGNIFHNSSEKIYRRLTEKNNKIFATDLEAIINSRIDIERAVDETFKEELFKISAKGTQMPDYNGLQIINREVIIRYIIQLLEIDRKLAPFEIVGLESLVSSDLTVVSPTHTFTTTIGGRIDRLDSVNDGSGERIRVIDYKTGSHVAKPLPDAESIFNPDCVAKNSNYYLQTMLYSLLVSSSESRKGNNVPVSPALLFIQHATADDYDPTLCFGKQKISSVEDYREVFTTLLNQKIAEIFDASVPFRPTDERSRCVNCPYKSLCGSHST